MTVFYHLVVNTLWQKKGINEQVEKVEGSSRGDHNGQYCESC